MILIKDIEIPWIHGVDIRNLLITLIKNYFRMFVQKKVHTTSHILVKLQLLFLTSGAAGAPRS